MDIVKGETIKYDLRKFLIVGVEKSGKTTFIGTMPRPALVFCGETGAEARLGGQKDIDFVRCYDLVGEEPGAGLRRFTRNFKQLLNEKSLPYKTVAIDPLSFLSDAIVAEVDRENPGLKGSSSTFHFWGLILDRHVEILQQILGMAQHIVVTSHVKLKMDETTGREMYLPDLNGKIRDGIGGWFDAVLFTITKPIGAKTAFKLQALPDAKKKCGVRVPLGMEDRISKEIESDYGKLIEALGGKK
jgi:hypothetical protein